MECPGSVSVHGANKLDIRWLYVPDCKKHVNFLAIAMMQNGGELPKESSQKKEVRAILESYRRLGMQVNFQPRYRGPFTFGKPSLCM